MSIQSHLEPFGSIQCEPFYLYSFLCWKGSKSFECNECGRSFYEAGALVIHKSIHTGTKQYKCDDCGKCFTTANIRKQHQQKHLLIERPNKCSLCSAAFYTRNDLRIHFRTHSREQPYLCCQCGKRFARKTHLNFHLSECHLSCDKIPFECFWYRDCFIHLLHFLGTHTGIKPFDCQFCQKSFALSGDLTAHIRVSWNNCPFKRIIVHFLSFQIHTGVRPYDCIICQKSFNQSSARNIHMRVHTGKRSYVCQICNFAFTQSASLKRHMKIHMNSSENIASSHVVGSWTRYCNEY